MDKILEIENLFNTYTYRIDTAQYWYHNCRQWDEEEYEGMPVSEWVDEPRIELEKLIKDLKNEE